MNTYKLTIEYDGTNYAGWQCQPHQPTVQAEVEQALERITQQQTPVIAAGRTDAGVHAWGQVISFQTEKSLSSHEWIRALNGILPADIAVKHAEDVPATFHARYSATGKIYEYRILRTAHRSALERSRMWHVPKPLDIKAMEEAGHFFTGTHDFSSFQNMPTDTKNRVCRIESFTVLSEDVHVRIQVRADRFLKQMVRSMVGTVVEVGLGKRHAHDMKQILEATDRSAAGKTAPPHGLYLLKVLY
ncbi:MAG: tRNA pseudouridine(38-40) synthase TruA [Nitrospirales bacterium]|nr:tRNA pseudouridine(38-40) synthase TruA [Nitrospira sp.]MDR4499909.1 tRNA pseudouridine(38-40) synthase TruA [Nitrospirales bacterium]